MMLTLCPADVAAQDAATGAEGDAATQEDADQEEADEQETEASAEGAVTTDYEEMEQLEQLEASSLAPTVLGLSGEWNPDLLAPYSGMVAAIRRDAGLIHELRGLPEATPRGSKLLEVESARQRLRATEFLGRPAPLDQAAVLAYIDFFDGRGKPLLSRWLRRMQRYEPMIREVLSEEGLPEDLIYVAMIESGFNPTTRSPAAAVGLWQFIEPTGLEMGLRIDRHVDERRDPVKATRAAARYLKYLHERFGAWPLALASYNGGLGLIDRETDRYNTNNYWVLRRRDAMYEETRRYVPRITAAGIIGKNLDLFGLKEVVATGHQEWTYDLVQVENPTRLSTIASAVGTDVDTLRDLNPELRTNATPPPLVKGNTYPLRIPRGTAPEFVARFDKVDVTGAHEVHQVQVGENIDILGRIYGIKPRVLRAANDLGKRERLTYGESIIIPLEAKGTWSPDDKKKETVFVPRDSMTSLEGRAHYVYEVNEGDTVEVLGRAFGLNPADIIIWNDLDPDARLHDGMHLQIFLPPDRDVPTPVLQPASEYQVIAFGSPAYEQLQRAKQRRRARRRRYHRVRPNESLWLIARRYKTTVGKLRRLNPSLRRSNTLQPGEKIRVK